MSGDGVYELTGGQVALWLDEERLAEEAKGGDNFVWRMGAGELRADGKVSSPDRECHWDYQVRGCIRASSMT
jgi:hypothetical protein